jgi:inner membrane protein
MALITVLIVCAFMRTFQGWFKLLAASLVGVASHLLLDWTNTYGVRLFLPFSSEWLHLDLNPLMDLWIIAVLLMAWLMVYIIRMVNAEIGAKPGSGRGLAIFALVFFAGYDFSKYLLHQQAIAVLNSRIYDRSVATRVAAFPAGSNPLVWRGWVETPTFLKQINVNVMGDFDPGAGATFYKPDNHAAIAAAKATPEFQAFLGFDQYPRWTVTPVAEPEGGNRVELLDLRLPFRANAILDSQNRVLRASMSF